MIGNGSRNLASSRTFVEIGKAGSWPAWYAIIDPLRRGTSRQKLRTLGLSGSCADFVRCVVPELQRCSVPQELRQQDLVREFGPAAPGGPAPGKISRGLRRNKNDCSNVGLNSPKQIAHRHRPWRALPCLSTLRSSLGALHAHLVDVVVAQRGLRLKLPIRLPKDGDLAW